jgi:hypothetical protein
MLDFVQVAADPGKAGASLDAENSAVIAAHMSAHTQTETFPHIYTDTDTHRDTQTHIDTQAHRHTDS